MTTAKAIEDITDSGLFEKLANAALRFMHQLLTGLVETGTNASGETRKDPYDAFCLISRDHFAMVAHTTESKNLKRKWLNEKEKSKTNSPDLGDLIKIIRHTIELRKTNQNLRVSVYLSTSQHVSSQLMLDATAIASKNNVELTIVDQSSYAHFLGNTANGQYLRRQYLAIDAELISPALLQDLMAANLTKYCQVNYIDKKTVVKTEVFHNVLTSCTEGGHSLSLLAGSSGFGKSTLCHLLLQAYYDKGMKALWITPEIIETALDIYEAIEKQLKAHHPKLYVNKEEIKELFGKNTLLVIDDVNKSQNPAGLIDRIIALATQLQGNTGINIVCPVWPKYFALVQNKEQKQDSYRLLLINKPSFTDAYEIVKQGLENNQLNLTENNIRSVIKDTAQDPLLMNLFAYLIKKNNAYSPTQALEVIANIVKDKINTITAKSTTPSIKVKTTFEKLGYRMLEAKVLNPSYNTISAWFSDDKESLRILDIAGEERDLFYFGETGEIIFRHDRVRDYIMFLGLHGLASAIDANSTIFADPYFAELIAHFIAEAIVSGQHIEKLLQLNPLGVFQSLRYLQCAEKQPVFAIVVENIKIWNTRLTKSKISKSVIDSIAFSLLNFDTRNIQDITQGLPWSSQMALARFRNGICIAGLEYLANLNFFILGHPNFWWDSIIEQVKVRYEKQYISQLNTLFQKGLNEKGRRHAYVLAGYLKSPELVQAIMECWNTHTNENDYAFFLWGILNCIDANDKETLQKVFSFWRSYREELTPAKRKYHSTRFKPTISNEVSNIAWYLTAQQVALLNSFRDDDTVNELVLYIVGHIDSPATLSLLVKLVSRSAEEVNNYGQVYMKTDRWDFAKFGRRLSMASLQFLKNTWSTLQNKKGERKIAFRIWMNNESGETVLNALKNIKASDEDLYDTAIFKRTFLKDLSVIPEYLLLTERKKHAIGWADQLWNAEVKDFFMQKMESCLALKDQYDIDIMLEVLRDINQSDADEILTVFWENLKPYTHALLTALYIATDNSRSLATAEINRLGFDNWESINDFYRKNEHGTYMEIGGELVEEQMINARFLSDEFKYIDMVFGCRTQKLDTRLTIDKLTSLQPFVILLSQRTLNDLSDHCVRFGFTEWMNKWLVPFFDDKNKAAIIPTDEDLILELSKIIRGEKFQEVDNFIDRLEVRRVNRDRFITVLAKFVEKENSVTAAIMLNKCLVKIGMRKDVKLFDGFKKVKANLHQIEEIKLDTAYMIARNTLE